MTWPWNLPSGKDNEEDEQIPSGPKKQLSMVIVDDLLVLDRPLPTAAVVLVPFVEFGCLDVFSETVGKLCRCFSA